MSLFTPFRLPASGVDLPNRLALAPMTTYSSHEDGTITDDEIAYLARRAASGLGTIITAACYVERAGKAFVGQWACDHDRHLPMLARTAAAIKKEGAVAILQIHDGGRMSNPQVVDVPRSASDIPSPRPGVNVPRPMTEEEIQGSIQAFGDATRRAVQAGFDGVEIHGANTYLLQQFYSPHANRRDDAWGGDRDRRMAYPLAVAEAVLAAAVREDGSRAVVGYRFSPEEIEEPGLTMDDTYALVDALAALQVDGLGLDYLHISLRDYKMGSMRDESDTRRRIPLIVDKIGGRVPLMGVGSVTSRADGEAVLADGADLVAVGRAALIDPEWAAKIVNDEPVRACVDPVDGQTSSQLPPPMYQKMLDTPGWIPICGEE